LWNTGSNDNQYYTYYHWYNGSGESGYRQGKVQEDFSLGLLIILASILWSFKELVGRGWF
jgi:hypothetical protein